MPPKRAKKSQRGRSKRQALSIPVPSLRTDIPVPFLPTDVYVAIMEAYTTPATVASGEALRLYRSLLSIPRIARRSLNARWQDYWQMKFTICGADFGGYRYTLNGVLHRVDGYATKNGNSLASYRFGKRHSVNDKPAVDDSEGKKWYDNGLLHRNIRINDLLAPAIIANNRFEWYQNNKLHNTDTYPDGRPYPALLHTGPWNGSVGFNLECYIEYRTNGKLHNSFVEDGQSCWAHYSRYNWGMYDMKWAQNGEYHRMDRGKLAAPYDFGCVGMTNMHLPATIRVNRGDYVYEWLVDGKLHRADRGVITVPNSSTQLSIHLPAVIKSHTCVTNNSNHIMVYEWYKNGVCFRDDVGIPQDMPFITTPITLPNRCSIHGSLTIYEWLSEDKKRHSSQYATFHGEPNVLLPAMIGVMDGVMKFALWYTNGKLHRDNHPAVIIPEYIKIWCEDATIHRVGAPAVIGTDGTEMWVLNGKFHRDDSGTTLYDSPALTLRSECDMLMVNEGHSTNHGSGGNGTVSIYMGRIDQGDYSRSQHKPMYGWYMMGKLHRTARGLIGGTVTQLPALILRSGSRYWYKEGKKHRDPDNGVDMPAGIIVGGKPQYWRNGEKYKL